jgi:DNA processing protein
MNLGSANPTASPPVPKPPSDWSEAPNSADSDAYSPAPLPVAVLDEAERVACLRLIRSENIGPVTFRDLINHCGGAQAALDALPDLVGKSAKSRTYKLCTQDAAERELEAARARGATPVFTIEPGYPAALAATENPPPLLYVTGNAALLNKPIVAIVGSRDCSAAGATVARNFAADLGADGYVIVSGLARGIDAAAHRAALRSGTVAVHAGGPGIIYPPEHRDLYAEIAACGCHVTEQPPGYSPRARDFPRRNRIISGVALAVLVVEAAQRSGTLTTARFAAEQGREVFAVPGHTLDPRADGTNQLIRDGATLARTASDITAELGPITGRAPFKIAGVAESSARLELARSTGQSWTGAVQLEPGLAGLPGRGTTASRVLVALGPSPIDIDALMRATALPIRDIQIALIELDLAGRIERHGAQMVSLRIDGD